MAKTSFYNPSMHEGFLPVRVLSRNIIEWIEKISPELFEDLSNEIKYNNLKPGIVYHIDKSAINDVAYLDKNRAIHLHENFNAYLWCISYSLFVLYEETIHQPLLSGTFTGKIDLNNKVISEAVNLFEYAMSLRNHYGVWDQKLPNPEIYDPNEPNYIGKTNGFYVSAMAFIISHEVAHSYYQHITYDPNNSEQAKAEEIDADNYAIDHFKAASDSIPYSTLKFGAVIGLCSLLFLRKDFNGGDSHPNLDQRLTNLLERLDLEDEDNPWGVVSLAMSLWARYYKIDIELPPVVETYKEVFYHMVHELNIKLNQ